MDSWSDVKKLSLCKINNIHEQGSVFFKKVWTKFSRQIFISKLYYLTVSNNYLYNSSQIKLKLYLVDAT